MANGSTARSWASDRLGLRQNIDAVLKRLRDVVFVHPIGRGKIGDRSRDLEDAVVRAWAEHQPVGGCVRAGARPLNRARTSA